MLKYVDLFQMLLVIFDGASYGNDARSIIYIEV